MLNDIVVHSKVFECLFFLVLFYSQPWHLLLMFEALKNLNENSFHMWKMNIEFLLHDKDL